MGMLAVLLILAFICYINNIAGAFLISVVFVGGLVYALFESENR